jgi:Nucleotidyl transferase AbiEii toxin, Type IV TA system
MHVVAQAAEAAGNPSVRLEGGTALAAYFLGHRESEDLDFFSDFGFDQRVFADAVIDAGASQQIHFDRTAVGNPTFVRLIARDGSDPASSGLKIDLAGQSPFRLAPLEETTEGIRIASYRDLAANKLHAASDRFEVRDFIDLHVILTHGVAEAGDLELTVRQRTREIVRDVMEIDPGLNPRIVGNGVARALDRPLLTRFPLRLLIPLTEAQVQESLRLFVSECAMLVADSIDNPESSAS